MDDLLPLTRIYRDARQRDNRLTWGCVIMAAILVLVIAPYLETL